MNLFHWIIQHFVFFSALQLPVGKTTVMHLVARENLPEPNNQGIKQLFLFYSNMVNRFPLQLNTCKWAALFIKRRLGGSFGQCPPLSLENPEKSWIRWKPEYLENPEIPEYPENPEYPEKPEYPQASTNIIVLWKISINQPNNSNIRSKVYTTNIPMMRYNYDNYWNWMNDQLFQFCWQEIVGGRFHGLKYID